MERENVERNFGFLGRLLDRLEANGWVQREPCSQDRRAKRIRLASEVGPVMREMRTIAAGLRRDAMSGFTAEEQEAFVDVLLAIKSNLTGLNGQGPSERSTRRHREEARER